MVDRAPSVGEIVPMTRDELADLADRVGSDEVPTEAATKLSAALVSESDPVARAWSAILWGALFDRGVGPDDAKASRAAARALIEIADGTTDLVQDLDSLSAAHPVYDESTGIVGARCEALASIAAMGPLASDCVDGLIVVLERSGDADGPRVLAAEALGAIAARGRGARVEDPRIVAALTRAVNAENDGEGTIREAVLGALREIGSPARAAIPTLNAALGRRENAFLFESIGETLAALDAS